MVCGITRFFIDLEYILYTYITNRKILMGNVCFCVYINVGVDVDVHFVHTSFEMCTRKVSGYLTACIYAHYRCTQFYL